MLVRAAAAALAILPVTAAAAQAVPEGHREVATPAGKQPFRMFVAHAKAAPRQIADRHHPIAGRMPVPDAAVVQEKGE